MATALRTILLVWVLLIALTACASRSPSLSSASDGRAATAQGGIAGPTSDANSRCIATTGSGSCSDATHPGSATHSTLPGSDMLDATSAAVAPTAPPPHDCTKAAQHRARVPQLLAEGRLHRTLRVIEHANQLCPETATETWLPELRTLAEIGRYRAAHDLANMILATAPSDDVRTSVEQALKLVRERDVNMPNTDEAKTPMRRAWRQADVAAMNRQYKEAAELFEQAWNLWHPNNGRALTAAGHFAKLAGDAPGAQRLFDRALEDLERQYRTAAKVELPTGFASIQAIAWHPKEQLLAVADGNEIVLVDAITSRERLRLQGHNSTVTSVAYSPDGKSLASGLYDSTVRLWRVADGTLIRKFQGHTGIVASVAYSPDGETLASGSEDNTVRLWRVADGSLTRVFRGHTHGVTSVAYSPDSKNLASGSLDQTVRLWRVADGSQIRLLQGHTNQVTSVAYSPDGMSLASGSWDDIVRLWRGADGSLIRKLQGHTGGVTSVAFSPDGKSLASGSHDKSVRLWRGADGSLIRSLEGHTSGVTSVAYSPDGTLLLTASTDGIRGWRASDGAFQARLLAPSGHDVGITFSGDAQYFDISGTETQWALEEALVCRIGPIALPVELCAERARVPGLLGKLLGKDSTGVEP